MNALGLYHDLKVRGIILEADGEHLKVNAPVGAVTEEDRTALRGFKPVLLKFRSRKELEGAEDRSDDRHFKSRRSKYPGYTSLYDPVHDEWHDFPAKDCFPSIVAEASKQNKGGAA